MESQHNFDISVKLVMANVHRLGFTNFITWRHVWECNKSHALKTIVHQWIEYANYVVTLCVEVHKNVAFSKAKSRRFSAKFANKMRF